jgi:hypothetical protein
VIGSFAGSLVDQGCDIEVQGQVLWLRFEDKRCLELRALGLKRLASAALGLDMAVGRPSGVASRWRPVARKEGVDGFDGKWMGTTAS